MRVFVTGGAGYVGSVLVPELLEQGHEVKVLDLYLFGDEVFNDIRSNAGLSEVKGDLRDQDLLRKELEGCDAVIHLACISNDPSFELNPELGKSINFDAFEPLVQISKECGVVRFIYASSSSVYGIKEVEDVTEEMLLEPLTDYSKYKALCETVLAEYESPEFCTVTVRPATVCGYSPRQRLDVIVNILTNHAVNTGKIKVFGGQQKRPNIHIKDMVRCYLELLGAPQEKIAGKIFNVGYQNQTVDELASVVIKVVGDSTELEKVPTDDNRSYHISSEKIARELGFRAEFTVEDAVQDLVTAFREGRLPDPLNNARYFNIKRMRQVELT